MNVRVLKSFESRKANGPKLTSYHAQVPTAVSQFYFRANVDRNNEKKPFIQLENLDPAKEYALTFISAVQEEQNNTVFHVIGDKVKSAEVNPSFNRNKDVVIHNIKPKSDGTIAIGFSLPKETCLSFVHFWEILRRDDHAIRIDWNPEVSPENRKYYVHQPWSGFACPNLLWRDRRN